MNKIQLIGNVTKDVELQEKGDVKYVCFTLAVNYGLEKDGSKHVDFFKCVAFHKQAETLAKYVKKGTKLAISAHMTSSKSVKTNAIQWSTFIEEFDFLPSAQTTEKTIKSDDDLPF